jgi:hypothetical protein
MTVWIGEQGPGFREFKSFNLTRIGGDNNSRCSVTIAKKSSNPWGRLYVNRNPNGGCNVPKVAKFLDE